MIREAIMPKDDPKGSFVQWQSITIGQLTYAINLILGFSVAALGFEVTLLLNGKFDPPPCWQKFEFVAALFSPFLLALSVGFGIWLVINRLRDFRATTTAARKREEGSSEEAIKPYRNLYRKLGTRTWCLFWLQIGTFGVGIAVFLIVVTSIFVAHWSRQTSYAGLTLGMNMAKVEYVKGEPDYVSYLNGQAESDTGALRLESKDIDEATIRKHFDWEYGKPYGDAAGIEIEFDPNTRQLTKIGCYDLKAAGNCPSLAGISEGMTEDEVIEKLGMPSTRIGRKGNATITYGCLGVFFSVIGNRVVALGIDVDAS
jgi:hypothetical protein